MKTKGFDRLLNVHRRLLDEGLKHHIYILGVGEEQFRLEEQIRQLGIGDSVTLLGYRENPYQYVSRCDLYVCSSHREGFSTAVTETPRESILAAASTVAASTELWARCSARPDGNQFPFQVPTTTAAISRRTFTSWFLFPAPEACCRRGNSAAPNP
jgi:glycosyltransferase involved in cell wall biosynthesis